MTTSRAATVVLMAAAIGSGAAADQPTAAPVAVVASAAGEATMTAPGGAPLPVRRFDRLGTGTDLDTSANGELVVVFRSGARARLAPSSRGRVETERIVRVTGTVETLARVPVLPTVAPVPQAGTAVAAVRVRAGDLTLRRPAAGQVTLADATVLSADAPAADGYDVEVEDDAARVVYRVRTPTPRIEIPAGVLADGGAYRWRMRATSPSGFSAEGQGHIATLPAEAAQARAALRAATAQSDPAVAALLAELDFALGLWAEALDGFRDARRGGLVDPVVEARIADLEARLAETRGSPRR